MWKSFNPLSLCRERPGQGVRAHAREVSIHSPYAGRDYILNRYVIINGVSIHSPYAGRDVIPFSQPARVVVSIHSPYAGRDCNVGISFHAVVEFQSTLPMQGETPERVDGRVHRHVSIHSPYAGRDAPVNYCPPTTRQFQSTLPMQGETYPMRTIATVGVVSIHSPYAGRDFLSSKNLRGMGVSIHSPYAGRDEHQQVTREFYDCFNPLSLCRERRGFNLIGVSDNRVSIHSPYAGRDLRNTKTQPLILVSIHSPYAGRDKNEQPDWSTIRVSIHSPYAGRDLPLISAACVTVMFQSTLPMQGETLGTVDCGLIGWVSIHSPYAGRDKSVPL